MEDNAAEGCLPEVMQDRISNNKCSCQVKAILQIVCRQPVLFHQCGEIGSLHTNLLSGMGDIALTFS